MTNPDSTEDAGLRWSSGVGGAQCDGCGVTTIVRSFGNWDGPEEWLCRSCVEGNEADDDDDFEDVS